MRFAALIGAVVLALMVAGLAIAREPELPAGAVAATHCSDQRAPWDEPTGRLDARLRERVVAATRRVDRRARRLAGQSYAGTGFASSPGPPHVAVRVTRGADELASALRPGLGVALRVYTVPLSLEELAAVRHRIEPHVGRGEDDVRIATLGIDERANCVVAGVISPRPDAVKVVQARFSPAVRVRVIARTESRLEQARLERASAHPARRRVTLHWTGGSGERGEHIDVRESPTLVRVGVQVRVPNGPRPAVGIVRQVSVTLRAPLGDRRLVDDRGHDLLARR